MICGELGISLHNNKAYDPPAKGKVENLNLEFEREIISWLDTDKIHSLEDANKIYRSFVDMHNHRMHGATKKTPFDHYSEMKDCVRVPESISWLEKCFLNRLSRKVRNDNTITLDNILFDVPYGFAGQRIEVRFRVDDKSEAFLFVEGKEYTLRPTNKEANAMARFYLDQTNNAPEAASGSPETPAECAATDDPDRKEGTESQNAAQMSPFAFMAEEASKSSNNK